jgi:hypothetical protein
VRSRIMKKTTKRDQLPPSTPSSPFFLLPPATPPKKYAHTPAQAEPFSVLTSSTAKPFRQLLEHAAEVEVGHLDPPVQIDQEIRALQVAMDDRRGACMEIEHALCGIEGLQGV